MSKRKTFSFSLLFAIIVVGIPIPRFEHSSASETGQVLGAFNSVSEPVIKEHKIAQTNNQPAPALTAKAVLVFDQETGSVLYSKNVDEKLPIASLTKLMTAIVSVSDPTFTQPVIITSADQLSVSPNLGLREGDVVMPEDLLKAMLIGSANDAALALSNHFPANKEFLQKMNEQAAALGMDNTHFSTPIGFDMRDNYSDAADLSKLVVYALNKLPYDEIWDATSYSFQSLNGRQFRIKNSNKLVGQNEEIKSIKTGKTRASLESMIVMAESKEGHQVVSILIGSKNREQETLKVIDYVFQNYTWE